MVATMLRVGLATVTIAFACFLVAACAETPTQPGGTALAQGAWTGSACLSITRDTCDLIAGCGHGRFPPPVVRADGSFEVDGTYRIEAGPVSATPAPPATFSGVVKGQTLTLTVTPRDASLPPASYVLQFNSPTAGCVTACV